MKVMKIVKNNPKSKELVKRTQVDETPFTIITDTEKNVSFGVMGKYKITEDYKTEEECRSELKKITWNRLIQIVMLIIDTLNTMDKEIKITKDN